MKELTLYLKSTGGFKENIPHSDTIFGAICWGIRLFYGEKILMDFIASYQTTNPVLLISSAFPFIAKENNITHLFPKVCSPPLKPAEEKSHYKLQKKFAKTQYVDSDLFQEIINYGYKEWDLWDKLLKKEYLLSDDEKILSKKKITALPMKVDTIPGNAVDRIRAGTIEGKLYHTNEVFFESDCGAFILLRCQEEWLSKVLAVFRFYGDKGIGGDFSVGKGHYQLEVRENFPFKEPVSGKHWISLSLYFPTSEEWKFFQKNSEDCWYKIIRRKGKMESSFSESTNIWKQSVIMIEEGSVFPILENQKIYGMLPVVKEKSDNTKIYHYGLAFTVKME